MYFTIIATVVESKGHCVVGVKPIVLIPLRMNFSLQDVLLFLVLNIQSERALLALPDVFLGYIIRFDLTPITHVGHEDFI